MIKCLRAMIGNMLALRFISVQFKIQLVIKVLIENLRIQFFSYLTKLQSK